MCGRTVMRSVSNGAGALIDDDQLPMSRSGIVLDSLPLLVNRCITWPWTRTSQTNRRAAQSVGHLNAGRPHLSLDLVQGGMPPAYRSAHKHNVSCCASAAMLCTDCRNTWHHNQKAAEGNLAAALPQTPTNKADANGLLEVIAATAVIIVIIVTVSPIVLVVLLQIAYDAAGLPGRNAVAFP